MAAHDNRLNSSWSGMDSVPDISDEEYILWRTLLEERTGMILPDERRSFLVTSLGIRMREIGFPDYASYYDYVLDGTQGAVEWAILVDRLTVHETRFFRHLPSIELIREKLLPEWTEVPGENKNLHLWSVGCSTGEEPYTLGILLDEFRETDKCDYYFGITASDISLASLSTGRKAIYHNRKLRDVEPHIKERYFTRINDTHVEVVSELRKRVCFAQMNVLDMARVPVGQVHMIMCQNLLIYFDKERRIEILNNLVKHMLPGAALILGSGEILGWMPPELERIDYNDTLAFRRKV
jgi:chemotaxis methyl-accepting protein methylase